MLKQHLATLMRGENLNALTCQQALSEILKDEANPLQIAAFLVLLRNKKETAEELSGMLSMLKKTMLPVEIRHRVLDVVGTGGDGAHTVNISTGSAILAASCGVYVAKHGNRAVSSRAGSADVLEALGVAIDLTPQRIQQCIDEVGIGFFFSPNLHPSMHRLRTLRQQLSVPTSLNLLGPFLNPAQPEHLLLGVYDPTLLPVLANLLYDLGTQHSMIVHGAGLDELSCAGDASVIEITSHGMRAYRLSPPSFGLTPCHVDDLKGGDARDNAALLKEIFTHGTTTRLRPISETLVFNAAVAHYLYGLSSSIEEGIEHAKTHLYDGSALRCLHRLIECSHDE